MSWQEDLFTFLWEELDFDDHPIDMGHSSQPLGQVRMRLIDGCLRLRDERITFNIIGCPDDVPEQENSILHLLSTHPRVASPAPGRRGLHRWTIPVDMLPESVLESTQMKSLLEVVNWDSLLPEDEGAPNIEWPQDSNLSTVHHNSFDWHNTFDKWSGPASQVAAYRYFLNHLKTHLEAHFDGWTWSLEIDNKPDRCGWYLRMADELHTLFTIFIGLGWQPDSDDLPRGFLLFERAPQGELDWQSEASQNANDVERTQMIRAFLDKPELAGEHVLPKQSENLWPLLISRAPSGLSLEDLSAWFASLLEHLDKAIWIIKTR